MASVEQTTTALAVLGGAIFGARLAGEAASRFKLPSVLGELAFGVLLGTLPVVGNLLRTSPELSLLAELGILLLLFDVGLHTGLADLKSVGFSATVVALLGMLVPMGLGFGVSELFFPGASVAMHLFLAATLAATSVGITARVLKDLGRAEGSVARTILGAAVIDDVLGLVLLGFVTSFALSGGAPDVGTAFWLVGKAALFCVLAGALGRYVVPYLFRGLALLGGNGAWLLVTGIALVLLFSYGATLFGLAGVVGAFFAGLSIEEDDYRCLMARGEPTLPKLLEGPSTLLVPLFFVVTGAKVDLPTLLQKDALIFGAVLTVVAIVGKLASGLGAGRGVSKLAVGVGMVPRGEVGLIFAAVGQGLILDGQPLLSSAVFGAVVLMVAVTTFVAPLWLQRLLAPTSVR